MPEIIPVFPLHTVLFPGGLLPLKIFETRYLDMVSECLRQDSGFGVCLIRQGNEVGQAASAEVIGTYARIMDFQQYPDGLLGISVTGQQRFRLVDLQVQPDNLIRGEIIRIQPESACPVPARFQVLKDLFFQLLQQEKITGIAANEVLEDAVALGYRLAELLPIALQLRQELLELTDPLARLDRLLELVQPV